MGTDKKYVRLLDPKVLKKEAKPFSWWRWWMMLLRMSWRGCVGTDTCKTHFIYFCKYTVAYLLLSWIFNLKFFSWQDVWTKNTWNKTWQEVLRISFWQKHKLQHLQWRVSVSVYPQCTKNMNTYFLTVLWVLKKSKYSLSLKAHLIGN